MGIGGASLDCIKVRGKTDVLRSDLIQCNDGVRAVRPLDIWTFKQRLLTGSRLFCRKSGVGGAIGGILY